MKHIFSKKSFNILTNILKKQKTLNLNSKEAVHPRKIQDKSEANTKIKLKAMFW